MKHPEKFGKVNVSDSLKIMKEQNATVMIDSIRTVKDLVSNFNFENSTASVDTGFYVVVGTFKNLDYAKRMEAKVKLKNNIRKYNLFTIIKVVLHMSLLVDLLIWKMP